MLSYKTFVIVRTFYLFTGDIKMHIFQTKPGQCKVKFKPNTKFDFIDRAAVGDIEAAAFLAEGYLTGKYECEINHEKARKWATYASNHGSELAANVLEELKKSGQ